ncbi:3-hydroxylacyl-ACP dehydratase [Guyparkeria sp. GHLCS8-2]|uniref:3-hydroxylacyl-ACP dehydratase n=1 Tax=Guyparkeria halopsychrophila TaxID=3139421 RepID=UPI0037C59312
MPTDLTALDGPAICARLPHHGDVCQLDRVVSADETHLVGETRAHRRADNPLRVGGQLGVFAGVEMAGQAMALHLALQSNGEAAVGQGMITRANGLTPHGDRLDDLPGPLRITVTCEAQAGEMARYGFTLAHEGAVILAGGLSVWLTDGV